MLRHGFCPYCGSELDIMEYEAHSGNVLWIRCPNNRCRGKKINIKTDDQGFILEPAFLRSRYLLSRPIVNGQ